MEIKRLNGKRLVGEPGSPAPHASAIGKEASLFASVGLGGLLYKNLLEGDSVPLKLPLPIGGW